MAQQPPVVVLQNSRSGSQQPSGACVPAGQYTLGLGQHASVAGFPQVESLGQQRLPQGSSPGGQPTLPIRGRRDRISPRPGRGRTNPGAAAATNTPPITFSACDRVIGSCAIRRANLSSDSLTQ